MILYHVEYNDVTLLNGYESAALAKVAADNWWAERTSDLPNGCTAKDCVWIVAINQETDEKLSSEEYIVESTGYHGDYAEHNTHWGL